MTLPTISYGENVSINFEQIPDQSIRAMLSRGVQHFLGSEQASKVGPNSAWFTKQKKELGRDPTDAEIAAQKAANLEAAVKALNEGTVGAGRGPKLDPIEAEMDRIATREVRDVLAANGLCKANRIPKDEDEFEFVDGSKFTFETLVERRLANPTFAPAIRKEAEKKVAEEKKKREASAKKAAEAVANAGTATPDALGL